MRLDLPEGATGCGTTEASGCRRSGEGVPWVLEAPDHAAPEGQHGPEKQKP